MFKKFMLWIGVLTVILSFSGCMANKPFKKSQIKSDKALVYVYGPASLIYRGTPYYVFVNGKTVATIINNSYVPLYVTPGDVTISLRTYDYFKKIIDKKVYKFEKGKTYFIRVKSGLYGSFKLQKVDTKTGMEEIKKTNFYENSLK